MGSIKLASASGGSLTLAAPDLTTDETQVLPLSGVTGGLVLVDKYDFSAASSVSRDNVFTSDYTNYRVVVTMTGSADVAVALRLRASSTDSSASYSGNYIRYNSTLTGTTAGTTSWEAFEADATNLRGGAAEIMAPALAKYSLCTSSIVNDYGGVHLYGGVHSVASAYDGFSLIPSSGTITGTVWVYGYNDISPQASINTSGLQLVSTLAGFSAVSSASYDNVFSADYDDYLLIFDGLLTSTAQYNYFRLRAASTDATTNYINRNIQSDPTISGGTSSTTYLASFTWGTTKGGGTMQILKPFATSRTFALGKFIMPDSWGISTQSVQTDSTSFDGFSVIAASGTISCDSIRVYGYRKAA